MRGAPGLVKLLKRGLHLIEVPLTRIRQSNARIAPLEEGNAELFLQAHDLAADGRLPDVERLRCPSQATVLSGGYEVTDFRELRHFS